MTKKKKNIVNNDDDKQIKKIQKFYIYDVQEDDEGRKIKYENIESMKLERDSLKVLISKNEQDRLDCLNQFVKSGVTSMDFNSPIRRKFFNIISDYYEEHKEAISYNLLRDIAIEQISYNDKKNEDKYNDRIDEIDTEFNLINKSRADKTYTKKLINTLIERQTVSTLHNSFESYNNELKEFIRNQQKGLINKNFSEILDTFYDRFNEQYKIYNNEYVDEDAIEKNYCDIERDIEDEIKEDEQSIECITTGFKVYDNLMDGGWRPGEIIIVSGRPGDGKSILLINNFAYSAFESGKNVLIFTKELKNKAVERRMYSRFTGIDYRKFKNMKNLNEEEKDLFISRKKELHDKGGSLIGIDITSMSATMNDIKYRIERAEKKYKRKVDIVFIDPIYLLNLDKYATKEEKDDRVGTLCIQAKRLACLKEIPIIVASQTNREGGRRHQSGQKANSMDMAFSDKLSQNADFAFMITNSENKSELEVIKQRDSHLPNLKLNKRFDKMRFEFRILDNDPEMVNKYLTQNNIKEI